MNNMPAATYFAKRKKKEKEKWDIFWTGTRISTAQHLQYIFPLKTLNFRKYKLIYFINL